MIRSDFCSVSVRSITRRKLCVLGFHGHGKKPTCKEQGECLVPSESGSEILLSLPGSSISAWMEWSRR